MKAIHACSSVGGNDRKKAGTAVCFVLDSAHANHTIRVFLRDQAPGAVARPISVEEAWRLIEIEPPMASGRIESARKKVDSSR
jgi:hypothetical protein